MITAPIPLALVGAARLAAMALVHERAEVIVIANDVRAGRSSGSPDFC